MNGSAHSAASVTDITLKRGPAGKFGSLLDFCGTVGAVETEFSPAVRFCAAGSARFNNKWRADLTGAVNPNGKSDDFHYTRVLWVWIWAGLGFNIVGGVDQQYIMNDSGIYVAKIKENGAAALDGRLQEGDKVIAINGQKLDNLSHGAAVELFRSAGEDVYLRVQQRPTLQNGPTSSRTDGESSSAFGTWTLYTVVALAVREGPQAGDLGRGGAVFLGRRQTDPRWNDSSCTSRECLNEPEVVRLDLGYLLVQEYVRNDVDEQLHLNAEHEIHGEESDHDPRGGDG
ncbi:synaptojanin-2-binding protein [Pimephales promelas]|nr:synaptojanin-2-binding protein [Pimephales promelas]